MLNLSHKSCLWMTDPILLRNYDVMSCFMMTDIMSYDVMP